ncbi:protein YIPF1 [Prorops nasuta]|uniref:protein YIPF1 n=1 Tax=Prorops nasuta TaxID=863751 RepID=UPI0034CF7152
MDGSQSKISDSQFISFQDFSPIHNAGNNRQAQLNLSPPSHQTYGDLSNDPTGIGILEDLQGMPSSKPEDEQQRSFWTVEYYQKYFNVNTNDVVQRIRRSMIPHGTDNYLITHIRPNPDLYGPFWICVTLIFAIAINGNMANYFQTAHTSKYHWKYDFHVVTYAATAIFLYAWLLPIALWGALHWTISQRNTEEELIEAFTPPGLLELLCLYGYSLAIYIPVAFLWTIQITWLQWILAITSTILSGGVLLRSLLPVIEGKHKIIYIVVILGMHLLLATGFMLCFFYASSKVTPVAPSVVSTTVSTIAKSKVFNNITVAAKTVTVKS